MSDVRWGLVGRMVFPLVFLVGAARGQPDELAWGFIDKTGKFAIEPTFEDCLGFSEGLAPVRKDGRWGYVNRKGEVVIQPAFDAARPHSEGLAAVLKGEKWGFIDRAGKSVIEPRFDAEPGYFSHGRARVTVITEHRTGITRKHGFADKTGETVIPVKFDHASPFCEGLAAVSQNGKWGYIDVDGAWAIEPRFAECCSFSEGLALATRFRELDIARNPKPSFGHWGYIDRTGKFAIEPQFYQAGSFSGGYAIISTGPNFQFVIDKTGEFVYGTNVDNPESWIFGSTGKFYGLVDETGRRLSLRYQQGHQFSDGLARVAARFGGPFGYIDRAGKEVIPQRFPKAREFSEGLAPAAWSKWRRSETKATAK